MRVAFLGHNQPVHASNPSGGWISKDEAKQKLREMAAEPISQRRIRAFPPGTAFRYLAPSTAPKYLSANEIRGCIFRHPTSPSWLLAHAEASRLIRTNARLERLAQGYDKPRVGSFCPVACGA